MLSDLDIKHRLELNMAGIGATIPATFDLEFLGSPEFPWQMKNIGGLITSGPAISIGGVEVRDENSNLIFNLSMVPWVFANTTQLINANQTPEVVAISFLGTNIGGAIPSDFYVYSNWTLTVIMLNPIPGSSYDLTAIFMEGFFGDKYRLSA
jgi:hypothetical protein